MTIADLQKMIADGLKSKKFTKDMEVAVNVTTQDGDFSYFASDTGYQLDIEGNRIFLLFVDTDDVVSEDVEEETE
jgi:hypothetical protein